MELYSVIPYFGVIQRCRQAQKKPLTYVTKAGSYVTSGVFFLKNKLSKIAVKSYDDSILLY